MEDKLKTTPGRSRNMAAIRSSGNTSTEKALANLLRERTELKGWRRGVKLVGRPDFVWPKKRVVIFVDGCFWHGCPDCYKAPTKNIAYWKAKLLRNQKRDLDVRRALSKAHFKVIRIWECRLLSSPTLRRIRAAVVGQVSH